MASESSPDWAQKLPSKEASSESGFDYSKIPDGFYDDVYLKGNPIRRAWHIQKFERVLSCLPETSGPMSLLDIGCFSGTFLSLVPRTRFSNQLGIDILPPQIEFAQNKYGTEFRNFQAIPNLRAIETLDQDFDAITLIEVIEHLDKAEIQELLYGISQRLKPGGRFIFTTPNYTSSWPAIEILLNRFSDVTYEEQHITKFTYFNVFDRLRELYPTIDDEFKVDFRTTTHFVTPFLAFLSVDFACQLSEFVPHQKWGMPFGNLILVQLTKT